MTAEGISSLTWRIRTATGVVESWNGTRATVISYAVMPTE